MQTVHFFHGALDGFLRSRNQGRRGKRLGFSIPRAGCGFFGAGHFQVGIVAVGCTAVCDARHTGLAKLRVREFKAPFPEDAQGLERIRNRLSLAMIVNVTG